MINTVTINLKLKTVEVLNSVYCLKYDLIKYEHHNHQPTAIYIIHGITKDGDHIKITLPKNITNLFVIE